VPRDTDYLSGIVSLEEDVLNVVDDISPTTSETSFGDIGRFSQRKGPISPVSKEGVPTKADEEAKAK
jgi:hypothetical protein